MRLGCRRDCGIEFLSLAGIRYEGRRSPALPRPPLDSPSGRSFENRFGDVLPDALNQEHHLVIVASELNNSTERLVLYLSGSSLFRSACCSSVTTPMVTGLKTHPHFEIWQARRYGICVRRSRPVT